MTKIPFDSDLLNWFWEFFCILFISLIPSITDWSNYFLIIPILLLIVQKIFIKKQESRVYYNDVRNQLSLIYDFLNFNKNDEVRCSFHKPVFRKKLKKVVGYIPNPSKEGEKLDDNKGIAGLVFHDKLILTENFHDDQEYRNLMVSNYKFTNDEMQKRSINKRSYFAFPLINENNDVKGVIFFDSNVEGTFCDEETNKKTIDERVKARGILRVTKLKKYLWKLNSLIT